MTPVFVACRGGGAVGLMPCPGRHRPLADDVALIAAEGVKLVLSLIEAHEQAETVAALPRLLAREGIAWRHFPVADFGIPDRVADGLWAECERVIHDRLDAGERVLLHCWGGRGRSGMIALRILSARGEDGQQALRRLRAVRPGAVETGAQLAWAFRNDYPGDKFADRI